MSFAGYKSVIEENDTVILYISFNHMVPVRVTPTRTSKSGSSQVENVIQTKFGALKVMDLVGERFGTKIHMSKGYAYALHPTPELWTKCLPHRTQILYATDISMVILQLQLKPGSVVIESGTGSGSLTHSLARTVGKTGRVYTFDFHQDRVKVATEEFNNHGLRDIVTAQHRDVCQDGFGLEDAADAVFLDLPHPWLAAKHAKRALKSDGAARLCSFSPCIEQVQKCSEALRKEGFKEIATLEVLLREFQVRRIKLPVYDPDRETNQEEQVDSRKRKLDEREDKNENGESSFISGIPLVTMPGHTGYLTFATLSAKDK